ncbi:hypothetical protein BH18THE2_BH18THE2_36780 [soil metagenome]
MTSKITLLVIKEYLEKKSYFSPVQEPVAFNGKFKAYRTNKEDMFRSMLVIQNQSCAFRVIT